MLSLSLTCASGGILLPPPLGGLNLEVFPRMTAAAPISVKKIGENWGTVQPIKTSLNSTILSSIAKTISLNSYYSNKVNLKHFINNRLIHNSSNQTNIGHYYYPVLIFLFDKLSTYIIKSRSMSLCYVTHVAVNAVYLKQVRLAQRWNKAARASRLMCQVEKYDNCFYKLISRAMIRTSHKGKTV